MAGQAHTPGPWTWWTSNSWRRLRHDDPATGHTVSVVEPYNQRSDNHPDVIVSEADMALIAAAPDMLAELKSLRKRFYRALELTGTTGEFADAAVAAADAIIAKAETPVSR